MDQPHLENLLGRACNSCRQVIYPQSESFECTYCRIPICQSCLNRHDSSHETAIVCVKALPSSEAIADETCVRCNKISFYRYSCLECVHSYCRDCWSEKSVNTHKHRYFGVVEPPIQQSVRKDQSLCCGEASFGHCDFCKSPLRYGDPTFVCKTCHKNSNELVFYCGQCQVNDGPLHDLSHRQWIWTLEVSEFGQHRIHCNICGYDFQHIAQLSQHPHMSYTLYNDWRGLEDIIFQSYRRCWNKQSRHDTPVGDGGDKECSACRHKFSYTEMNYCQACNLQTSFCPHCTVSATLLHYHPGVKFISFRGSPRSSLQPSEGLDKAMQQRKQNRSISISQPDTISGPNSSTYAQRASLQSTQQQQPPPPPTKLPNSPMPADTNQLLGFSPPSQQAEQSYRVSPVPTRRILPPEIQNSDHNRRGTHPQPYSSTSNVINSLQSLEPVAGRGGSFNTQPPRPIPSLAQSLQPTELFPHQSSPNSFSSVSPSSYPQSPQSFDSGRYGSSATSLSPASCFSSPQSPQSFNRGGRESKASSLSPAPQSYFPQDANPVIIGNSEIARNPEIVTKRETVKDLEIIRNPEPNGTAYQKPSSGPPENSTREPPQIRPELPVHSFSSPIPTGNVVPADQVQQATNARESNMSSAKMKATAAKWSKNKYVRAGAKIGAKIAISQISSNVIGVDVSGVVDGVGQVVSVANAVGGAMSSSGVDLSDVVGGTGIGGGSGVGDNGGVLDQVVGSMQNSNVQINLQTGGDWEPLQNRTNRQVISLANRFKNRKRSAG